MLYHCTDTLPSDLERTRALLYTVSDEAQPVAKRAIAALGIAHMIIENCKTEPLSRRIQLYAGRSFRCAGEASLRTRKWLTFALPNLAFRLAIQMIAFRCHPSGHSMTVMRQSGISPGQDVRSAWEGGAHLALLASSDSFRGWDKESLHAALTCIWHHVIYLPAPYGADDDWKTHVQQLAKWVMPLLSMLAEVLAAMNPNDTRLIRLIERRQQAIRLLLDERCGKFVDDVTHASSRTPNRGANLSW